MTVQTIQPSGVALTAPPIPDALDVDLAHMMKAQQIARGLVSSFFVPAAFKPVIPRNADPAEQTAAFETAVANATGAILLGQALGLGSLASLQQIYVVHGRPGMYAKIKVALVQAAGHDVWDEELTDDRAVVCGRRKGWPDDRVVRITVTMDDAKRAGWTTNDAYRKTPKDMLWSRAASRVVDRIGADVLFGIASVEDLDDLPEPTPVRSQVQLDDLPPAKTSGSLAALTAATVVREAAASARLDGETQVIGEPIAPRVEVEQVTPAPDPAKLWAEINARFVELGVTGPGKSAARLAVITSIVDRVINRGGDLTAAESQKVLDNLAGPSGRNVIDEVLTPETVEHEQQGVAEPDGDPLAVFAGEPDPAAYDPTSEPTWSGQ